MELVPFENQRILFDKLQRQQDEEGINAQWIRKAQGLAVSVYRPKSDHPAWGVLIAAKLRECQMDGIFCKKLMTSNTTTLLV